MKAKLLAALALALVFTSPAVAQAPGETPDACRARVRRDILAHYAIGFVPRTFCTDGAARDAAVARIRAVATQLYIGHDAHAVSYRSHMHVLTRHPERHQTLGPAIDSDLAAFAPLVPGAIPGERISSTGWGTPETSFAFVIGVTMERSMPLRPFFGDDAPRVARVECIVTYNPASATTSTSARVVSLGGLSAEDARKRYESNVLAVCESAPAAEGGAEAPVGAGAED